MVKVNEWNSDDPDDIPILKITEEPVNVRIKSNEKEIGVPGCGLRRYRDVHIIGKRGTYRLFTNEKLTDQLKALEEQEGAI